MKKTKFTFMWFVCFSFCCLFGWQNVNAQIVHGTGTVTTCNDTYVDTGGAAGNYTAPDAGSTTTICPTDATTELIEVTFNTFDLEGFGTSWDALYIYDGTDNTAPQFDGGTPNQGTNCGGMPGGYHDAFGDGDVTPFTITATGPTGCLHFFFCADGGSGTGWEADVVCVPRPNCAAPNGLAAANITFDGADVSWISNNTPNTGHTWDVEYGPAGFTPGTGTVVAGLTVTMTTITGLDSATDYEFYVTENCDGTDGSSDASAAGAFTTLPDYCGGDQYVDNGGIGGNYLSNSNEVTTICPDVAGDIVAVKFNTFATEGGWDALYVFDGPTTASPIIPSGNDPTIGGFPADGWDEDTPLTPDNVLKSTDASGCLTFQFLSDGAVTRAGWDADVVCVSQCPEVAISDPCVCNDDHSPFPSGGVDPNDGTFAEEIEITTAAVGDTWTATAVTGLINTMAGDVFTDGGAGDDDGVANGVILIQDAHFDAAGYSITVTDGFFTLDISNLCFYPVPVMNVPATFCTNGTPITLTATELNGEPGVFTFGGPGVTGDQFDPATLAPGTYTITATIDADEPAVAGDPNVGCIQTVEAEVIVGAGPASLVCNDNVQVSLNETCLSEITPDMILEAADGCDPSFTVEVVNNFGAPLATSPFVGNSEVGNTYTVRVVETISGNFCWGSITVEDKLAPELTCPAPISVPCTVDPVPGASAPLAFLPAPLVDNSSFSIPFEVTAGTVADVDLLVNLQAIEGVIYNGNIRVSLTSPAGTTVQLVNTIFGCDPAPLFVVFDDEGTDALACASFSTGINAQIPFGVGLLSDFDGEDADGIWTLNMQEVDGGGDILSLIDAAVIVNGTSFGPQSSVTVPFPNDLVLGVNVFAVPGSANTYTVPAGVLDCSAVTLTYLDDTNEEDCASGLVQSITRSWLVVDASGNEDNCEQIITIERPELGDITFPEDITWQCTQFDEFPNITGATALDLSIVDSDLAAASLNVSPTTPDNVLATTGSGLARINGLPVMNGDICGITCQFEDSDPIEVCPGTTKILRTWTCIDWCAGEQETSSQIVKVVDEVAPNLIDPGALEVDVFSASAPAAGIETNCEGNPVIPAIADNGDNCSSIASYNTQLYTVDAAGNQDELIADLPTNGGQFMNIPLYDDNGNAAQYIVCYEARDECDNKREVCVELTIFDKVPPVAICDEITQISITNSNANGNSCSALAAEDLDDGSYDNCTDVHFLVSRMNNADPTNNNNIYTPLTDFCCEDIPGPVDVILLVLDDVAWNSYLNNYGQIQPDGQLGLRGTRLDLTSDDNDPTADMDGRYAFCMVQVLVEDKLAPTIVCPPNASLTCDEYADDLAAALLACDEDNACESAALTAAGFGDVTAVDNCSVETTPTVNVNIDQCGAGTVTRSFSGVDPSNNASNVCTQVITITHVSDWVVEFPMDQDGFCDQAEPDFGEPEIFFETCELIATSFEDQFFDVVNDACFKIVRQWTVINWCVVGNAIDQEPSAVELSEAELVSIIGNTLADLDGDGDRDTRTFRDSYRGVLPTSDNDNDTDNQDGFITYQQVIKVQDFDAPVIDATFTVGDLCIITGNDGTDNDFSDCAFSGILPTPSYDDCTLDVNGNIDNNGEIVENELTITATVFDAAGNVVSNSVVVSDLEIGCYVVRYVAIDRCGNTTATDFDFCVEDCKFPTPYCKDGVVLELMAINDPNNTTFEPMVELWASDLDLGSFDNCPGGVQLSFSANVNNIGTTYNCDNVGENLVQLWVTDAAGNQDFCETFVIIQANQGQCTGGDDPLVAGNVATETNLDVQDVTVAVNNTTGFGQTFTTTATGDYQIEVPTNSDVTITPSKDMNPRNGVSTFDLVKISKHILNSESLDSPYKMIAADANNSGTITTLDLVQIRKLILFIDDEFSNNSSWRFVDAAYNFPNATNPWAEAFPEVISLNDVTADQLANNFVAVKIGDVNGSAAANQLLGADDRNMTGALTLTAADVAMKAGETYTVEVAAANFNNFGYQFTMNFDADAMEFVSVGNGLATAENFGLTMLSEGAITASYYNAEAVRVAADEAVFTLTFVAKADAQLSEVLSINSRYTTAEAYAANGDVQNVELDFNNGSTVAGFELYQNTPNPFATETSIGFNLGADKEATITISDISGKVIKVIEVDGVKGYNQVVLSRNEVAASGILYYQLDTDTDSATKKMILID
jgi:hypothetical protein